MAYKNGEIPVSALTKLSTGGYLMADAARSFERMRVVRPSIKPTSAGDAYRERARQVAVFTDRYERRDSGNGPFNDVRWWNGKRYVRVKGAAAAVPGESNHGLGRTVDFANLGDYTSRTWREFAALAAEHGWNNIEGKRVSEPWHWTYVKANDAHRVQYARKVTTKDTWARATPGGKKVRKIKKGTEFWARKGSRTKDKHGREWLESKTGVWIYAPKTKGKK